MPVAFPQNLGAVIALIVIIVAVIALLVPVPGWLPLILIMALGLARLT